MFKFTLNLSPFQLMIHIFSAATSPPHKPVEATTPLRGCALANETAVNYSKYVADLKVRYKDLNSTFRTHCKGKKPANKRVKAFKANQSKKAKAQIDAAKNESKDPFGSDSSDSSNSEPEDSQESLIEEICSVKGDLDDFEMRKVAALKREDESRIKIQNLKKDSVYE
jgi:hypothetical protein